MSSLARTVPELIADRARERPKAPALSARSATGSHTEVLDYAELLRRADTAAEALRAAGVGRGAVVGVCTGRTVAAGVGLLAVLRSGAAYLPLDPDYPDSRLALFESPYWLERVEAENPELTLERLVAEGMAG